MTYLDVLWIIFCTEIVVFFGLLLIVFAWSVFDCIMHPTKDFNSYGQ